jgi:predicted nucleic acid-binding Zn ribbon protein
MSQPEPTVSDETVALDSEDRAWLDERLREYRELLAYLQDH